MNPELLERVRNECAGVYINAREDHNPNFGIDWSKGTKLMHFAEPYNAFSGFRKLFLPKPLKQVATSLSYGSNFGDFNIFHYPLNEKRVEEQIEEMTKTDRFFWERGSRAEPFDEVFFASFKERFSPASVIYSDFWEYSLIIGRRDINQRVMDCIKENPNSFFDLMRSLSPIITETINYYQEITRTFHIYDLLKDPKAVHFQLPTIS